MFKTIRMLALLIAASGASGASSAAFAAVQTATLDVPGMTCSTCPITVKKVLMKVDGVQQVKSSFAKREAVVTFDDSKTSPEKISMEITNAGYPATVKTEK